MAKLRTKQMQEDYVKARLMGKAPDEARQLSGYSEATHTQQLEAPGSPCAMMLWSALDKAGLTEEFLAMELRRGIKGSIEGPRDTRDYGAHAKYMYTLSTLRGYGRGPLVAIQNNYAGDPGSDPQRDRELARKTEKLLALLEAEALRRKPDGVYAMGIEPSDPSTRDGVGESGKGES